MTVYELVNEIENNAFGENFHREIHQLYFSKILNPAVSETGKEKTMA